MNIKNCFKGYYTIFNLETNANFLSISLPISDKPQTLLECFNEYTRKYPIKEFPNILIINISF